MDDPYASLAFLSGPVCVEWAAWLIADDLPPQEVDVLKFSPRAGIAYSLIYAAVEAGELHWVNAVSAFQVISHVAMTSHGLDPDELLRWLRAMPEPRAWGRLLLAADEMRRGKPNLDDVRRRLWLESESEHPTWTNERRLEELKKHHPQFRIALSYLRRTVLRRIRRGN